MKKIILILGVFLIPLLSNAQTDEYYFEWGPCIGYNSTLGWNASITFTGPSSFNLAQFYVHHNGNIFGPNQPSAHSPGSYTFSIPTTLEYLMLENECIEIHFEHDSGFLPPYWQIKTLCPCPPKDDCIAQFEFKGNTQTLTWPNLEILFDDNEYPIEGAYANQLFNSPLNSDCLIGYFDIKTNTLYQRSIYISDHWDYGDNNSFSMNSRTHSSSYSIPNLSHSQTPYNYTAPGSYTVCHRKVVSIGYQPYDLSTSPSNLPLYDANVPCSEGVLYDCKVCYDICVDDPYTNGEVIYSHPETISSKGAMSKSKNDNFSIFPNPASNEVTVSFHSTHEKTMSIKLVDITGKIVKTIQIKATVGSNTAKIAIPNISNGQYIISIDSDVGNVYREKISILK